MDRRLLAAAYDRSAEGYDERFRSLQRVKYRAALPLLWPVPPGALAVDAGAGTGLWLEFLRDEAPQLASARWLLVDVSTGMLRQASQRTSLVAAADVASLPVRQAALVCAFTSVLDAVPHALRELGRAVAPGGQLCVTFLRDEAPDAASVARFSGLSPQAGPIAAGQDLLFVLHRKEAP